MYIQRVIIVEPNKDPYVKEIENNFSEMQKIVDGPLNFVYLEEGFFVIHHSECNDEVSNLNFDLHGTFLITKGLEHIDNHGVAGVSLEETDEVIETLLRLKETNASILDLPKEIRRQTYKIS
jgi:hypothetical protein